MSRKAGGAVHSAEILRWLEGLTQWPEGRQGPLPEPASGSWNFQFRSGRVVLRGKIYCAENLVQSKGLRVCHRFRFAPRLE